MVAILFSSICQLFRRYINRSWESNGRWLSYRDIQISGTSTLFCAKNIERVHSNKLYKNKTFGSIVTIWIFDVFCIETVRCLISQVHLTRVQFQQLLENNPNENLNTFFLNIIFRRDNIQVGNNCYPPPPNKHTISAWST